MALRRESPLGSGAKRASSSPPSPVFDFAPMRFVAIASVSCASALIEPNDIAPVANRFTISYAGFCLKKRAERHRARGKSLHNLGCRLHFLDRYRTRNRLQLHQTAQRIKLLVLLVDQL